MESFPLSHSSATTLKGCEQKYAYYKVDGVKRDADYAEGDALRIGKAFHKILETHSHTKPPDIRADLDECTTDPDILLPENRKNLVHAMVVKYLRLHTRLGREVVAVEFGHETESFIGYIDALMADPDGGWYICDLKTAKTLHDTKINSLSRDPQLNLYTAYMQQIAKDHGLEPAKFKGCLYRVTTKPALKQKVTESDIDYIKRMIKSAKSYEILVPFDKMDPDSRLSEHLSLYDQSMNLRRGQVPTRNYNNCTAYFSSCAYWSRCYGDLYSNMPANLGMEKEEG